MDLFTRLRALGKDASLYGSSTVISQIVGLLLLPVYTRYLSVEEYGIISLVSIVSVLFTPLANLGLNSAVFRYFFEFSKRGSERELISTATVVVSFMSLWLLIFVLFFSEYLVDIFGYASIAPIYIQLAAIHGCLISASSLPLVVMRLQKNVKEIASRSLVGFFVNAVVSLFCIVVLDLGVEGFLIGNVAGALIIFVLVANWIPKNALKCFDKKLCIQLFKYGLPFLPHHFLALGIANVSQVVIATRFSLIDAGLYSIGLRMSTPLLLIVNSFNSTWAAAKHEIFNEEKNVEVYFGRLSYFYIVILIFLWFVFCVLGAEIIKAFLPEKYYAACMLLPFVSLIPLAQGFRSMMMTGLEFSKSPFLLPGISLVGFMFAIGLSGSDVIVSFGVWAVPIIISLAWIIIGLLSLLYSRVQLKVKHRFLPMLAFAVLTSIFSFLWYAILSSEDSLSYYFKIGLLVSAYSVLVMLFLVNRSYLRKLKFLFYP